MSLAKDKYREETNEDCYCEAHQVEGGSYKDEYVLWLEQQVNTLILPVVRKSLPLIEGKTKSNIKKHNTCRKAPPPPPARTIKGNVSLNQANKSRSYDSI